MSGLAELRGKVAVVTGGASGIGKGIAAEFVPEGMRVIIADMTRDEVYVFRSFDSDPACAEQVPHSAFVNRSCPASAPPRASIEIRMFAFYAEPAR